MYNKQSLFIPYIMEDICSSTFSALTGTDSDIIKWCYSLFDCCIPFYLGLTQWCSNKNLIGKILFCQIFKILASVPNNTKTIRVYNK